MRRRSALFVASIAASTSFCLANPGPQSASAEPKGTAVVYPVVFSRDSGAEGSRKTAVASVREALQKAGYSLASNSAAASVWKRLRIPLPSTDQPPKARELARFGREMKADFVVSAVFDFHSRSIWVDLGPRTVSTAKASVSVFAVGTGKVVYRKRNAQGRSDEKANAVKIAADVLLTPLVTVVSGGPKTPQEQRAVQIAVARAMQGWLKKGV
jgi:hypothetical protein